MPQKLVKIPLCINEKGHWIAGAGSDDETTSEDFRSFIDHAMDSIDGEHKQLYIVEAYIDVPGKKIIQAQAKRVDE